MFVATSSSVLLVVCGDVRGHKVIYVDNVENCHDYDWEFVIALSTQEAS